MPPKRQRQKRCLTCRCLFMPDRRSKDKQRHCSGADCQRIRRNANIRDWYWRNPDCLESQQQSTRDWFKDHPDYSRQRRLDNPSVRRKNCLQSKIRMRKIRSRRLFDKTNSIISQLNGNKQDKCFLTRSRRWLVLGLTKQTRWRSSKVLWENHPPELVALPEINSGYLLPLGRSGEP